MSSSSLKPKQSLFHLYGVPIDERSRWREGGATCLLWQFCRVETIERRHGFPSWSWVGWKGIREPIINCATRFCCATDVKISVELSNGILLDFGLGQSVRSVYPPECSRYIRIRAWTTVFRLRKDDAIARSTGGLIADWIMVEPSLRKPSFEDVQILKIDNDATTEISCLGILMAWGNPWAMSSRRQFYNLFSLGSAD